MLFEYVSRLILFKKVRDFTMAEAHFQEITVLYGSQTGTAEDVARYLHRQLFQVMTQTKCNLYGCDEFLSNGEQGETKSRLIICVIATTGNGDYPENMRFFWRAVMSRQFDPVQLFGDGPLHFAVLGLGDSSYERFNFIAKKLDRRFEQVVGKTPFVSIGLADDQDKCGLYTVADQWIASLFDKLGVALPSNDALPNFRFKIINSSDPLKTQNGETKEALSSLLDLPCDSTKGRLIANDRLTSDDHFQDVRLVRIETTNVVYYPGDVCYIQPSNVAENIAEFLEHTGLHGDEVVNVNSAKKSLTLTVGDLAKNYFNLCFVPSRSFFDLFGRLSNDAMEKERLHELVTNYDDLLDYSLKPKRSVLEVFGDFRQTAETLRQLSTAQRLAWLFELIPPIRARAFSIASAQIEVGAEIQLLVAVVKYQTKIRKQRRGLCTSWLTELPLDSEMTIWIRPSSMRFPKMRPAPSTEPFPPIIMVGPGTGLAPFRAYVQYRAKLANIYGSDILWATNGNLWLFFGCRFAKHDFLCENELQQFQSDNVLRLEVAFSRDSPEKVYVQHRIEANRTDIAEWILRRGANVCVAGNALQMPKDVKSAIRDALFDGDGLLDSKEEADAYIEDMQKSGRFVIEVWS